MGLTMDDFFERPNQGKKPPPEVWVPPEDQIPEEEPAPPPLDIRGPNGKRVPSYPPELTRPGPPPRTGGKVGSDEPYGPPGYPGYEPSVDPFAGVKADDDAHAVDAFGGAEASEGAHAHVPPRRIPWAAILVTTGLGILAGIVAARWLRPRENR